MAGGGRRNLRTRGKSYGALRDRPLSDKQIIDWLRHPPEFEEATPEIRQNFLTLAEANTLRSKYPERFHEIRGDLQMHTLWSDGSGSIQDMAEAARSRGYSYIAITDHSKGLKIAGGIDEDQLAKQGEEIAAVNESMRGNADGFLVLRSVELNLSPMGGGDMDPAALKRLDLVLGCFHSALRRKEDQTERYLAALRNPSIHILGHPRGRIYNFRLGLSADWAKLFALAAKLDKAVEIDCYPDRQDLSIDLHVVLPQDRHLEILFGQRFVERARLDHLPAEIHVAVNRGQAFEAAIGRQTLDLKTKMFMHYALSKTAETLFEPLAPINRCVS